MRAMLLEAARRPLREALVQTPKPGPGELLIQVRACGLCRTDLHVADRELRHPKLPLVLGHEIVGTVAAARAGVDRFAPGDRVGVPWPGWPCGAGGSDAAPPEPLGAAIIFARAGLLGPAALRAVEKGGTVVCAGIHMSDIPTFPYDILWGERVVRSVANLTRRDGEKFLRLAPAVPVRTTAEPFALDRANDALERLRTGRMRGAAVLLPHATA